MQRANGGLHRCCCCGLFPLLDKSIARMILLQRNICLDLRVSFLFSSSSNKQGWSSRESTEGCSSAANQAALKYFRFPCTKIISHFSKQLRLLLLLLANNWFLLTLCCLRGSPRASANTNREQILEAERGSACVGWALLCRIWTTQPLGLNFSSTRGRVTLSPYSKKTQPFSFRFTQGHTGLGDNPAHGEKL